MPPDPAQASSQMTQEALVMIARIDERTKGLDERLGGLSRAVESVNQKIDEHYVPRSEHEKLVAYVDDVCERVDANKEEARKFREEVAPATYVKVETFSPIQKLVFGCVAAVCLTVLGAVLVLVIHNSPGTSSQGTIGKP